MNFKKKMFELNANNMIIIEKTLEEVILENARLTTSPRGVEPIYHVVERDGRYELRVWSIFSRANVVSTHDTEEEADQARLEAIYDEIENSCGDRNHELHQWFDTEEDAINDLVQILKEDDDTVTYESIKGDVEDMRLDIENGKKTVARRLLAETKQAYDFWKANGQTKKASKLIKKILYGGYHHNNIWDLYIHYSDVATEDTMRMINEMKIG